MGPRIFKESRVRMTKQETEFKIVVKVKDPHHVIEIICDLLRNIEHKVLNDPSGSVDLNTRTYYVNDESEKE